ncbi:unnamed protein product, partial [Discosporangium mesarthrocarpum]
EGENRAPSPGSHGVTDSIHLCPRPPGPDGRRETSAELFLRVTSGAAQGRPVPRGRLFSLLSRARAAVAWAGGSEARVAAVRRRLMALMAMVYCHPSTEAITAFFGAQPELVQELVEVAKSKVDPGLRGVVPLDVCILAVHCLAALMHAWNGRTDIGLVTRHTNVFQELGITRGQYGGVLPSLVRQSVAELHALSARLHGTVR